MADGFLARVGPTLLASLVVLGALEERPLVVALAAALLSVLLAARLWSRISLHSLELDRSISEVRAFPGEELLLTLRLANRKPFPLPWVEVDDKVPHALQATSLHDEGSGASNVDGSLRLGSSLGWFGEARWSFRLRCIRRGIYHLGPATVTSGDPFGLFPRSRRDEGTVRLVVYPSLIPLERLGLPAGSPMGERVTRRWIFEDPTRPAGTRDYRPGDPFHQIHWKATARRDQIQVKLHEPTTTLEAAIFLGVDTFGESVGVVSESRRPASQTIGVDTLGGACRWNGGGDAAEGSRPASSAEGGKRELDFEYAVSVAATLAHRLVGWRHSVGLYLNGSVEGMDGIAELHPAAGQEQLVLILELLAAVQPAASAPLDLLLTKVAPRLPWGASVILVVGGLSERLAAAVEVMARGGRRTVVLMVGGAAPERVPAGSALFRLRPTDVVSTRRMGKPDSKGWEEWRRR